MNTLSLKFAVFLLALPLFAQSQNLVSRTLTLDEVVTLGMANSKALQVSAARLQAATAKTAQLRDAPIPTLSYYGAYNRLSDNVEPFVITLPDGTQQALNPIILNNYTNKVSISEPVFTGFRAINTIRAGALLENAARFDLDRDRKDVELNLRSAAINLYKLQSALKTFDQNLVSAQNRLADLQHLRDQGMALDNDVLRADLAVTQIESARVETANALSANQYAMDVLLGLPESTAVGIDSASLFTAAPEALKLDELIGNRDNRADLQAADFRRQAAEKQVLTAKGAMYPLVSVGANLYANNPNQRVFPPEPSFKTTWDAGVSLSWNLSSLYTSRHTAEEAKANLLQADLGHQQLSDQARTDIANNYYAWQSGLQKITLADKALAQAQENQRVLELRQQQQLSSASDLLDADAMVVQARINVLSARADARLAYFRLLKSAGRL